MQEALVLCRRINLRAVDGDTGLSYRCRHTGKFGGNLTIIADEVGKAFTCDRCARHDETINGRNVCRFVCVVLKIGLQNLLARDCAGLRIQDRYF